MKILEVRPLVFPEVKVIRFQRFKDERGYFSEIYRKDQFHSHPDLSALKDSEFVQYNESYSRQNTIRGMHFQWDPQMGKLVRTLWGHMVDIVLDIRKGSPTFGKMIAYDMPFETESEFGEYIWVPKGFAHGNYYLTDTKITYFCTSSWNPSGEASISPMAPDIDWSLCDSTLKAQFDSIVQHNPLISGKDKDGFTVAQWSQNPNSEQFQYQP